METQPKKNSIDTTKSPIPMKADSAYFKGRRVIGFNPAIGGWAHGIQSSSGEMRIIGKAFAVSCSGFMRIFPNDENNINHLNEYIRSLYVYDDETGIATDWHEIGKEMENNIAVYYEKYKDKLANA